MFTKWQKQKFVQWIGFLFYEILEMLQKLYSNANIIELFGVFQKASKDFCGNCLLWMKPRHNTLQWWKLWSEYRCWTLNMAKSVWSVRNVIALVSWDSNQITFILWERFELLLNETTQAFWPIAMKILKQKDVGYRKRRCFLKITQHLL